MRKEKPSIAAFVALAESFAGAESTVRAIIIKAINGDTIDVFSCISALRALAFASEVARELGIDDSDPVIATLDEASKELREELERANRGGGK